MMLAGVQVSSFKPFLQTPEDVLSSFRKIAAMGCRIVQVQWINPSISPEFIAGALIETGLVSVSTQDAYDVVTADLPNVIRLHELCGSTHVCVSGIPERFRSFEGCIAYAEELSRLSDYLESRGLHLSIHPRSQEYDLFDAPDGKREPAMTTVLNHASEKVLLGLDFYHILKAGLDPVQWMQNYRGRIDFVHFKDARRRSGGGDVLTPVGQGDTDWAPIVKACMNSDIPWAFAEQERWEKGAFECMQESFGWLLSQGFCAE